MKCNTDRGPRDEQYVGETKKATKQRMVEHHVMHRGEANESTTWTKNENRIEEEHGLRRSVRLKDKPQPNYRELDQGPPIWLTEGTSAVSPTWRKTMNIWTLKCQFWEGRKTNSGEE